MNAARWGVAILLASIGSILRGWVPDEGGVWPDGFANIAFEFASSAPHHDVDWNSAASEAMGAWNVHLQRLQLTRAPSTGKPWYDNGRNELFFADTIYGEPFPRGVLAATLTTTDEQVREESDIVFNRQVSWAVYRGALREAVDFRRVVVHELGHVLGLDHPDDAGQQTPSIMDPFVGDIELPTDDDQTGIHALYGRGPGGPPVVLYSPRDQVVKQGAEMEMTVVVGGRGPMTYEWRRNNVAVAGATLAKFQLPSAALSDAGDYIVVVTNSGGSSVSDSALLTVEAAVAPTASVDFPGPRVVVAGTDYTIGAWISGGDYPLKLEWKKDGVSIGFSDYPNLTIENVQFSNAGSYTLTVSNVAGSVTTAAVELEVVPGEPPYFEAGLPSFSVFPGSLTSLSASVSGTPPFTYQWSKDGVPLAGATFAALWLGAFGPEQVGSYTLTVSNRYGTATTSPGALALRSVEATVIVSQPRSVSTYPGKRVGFSVQLANASDAQIQWYKDGVPLTDTRPEIGISGAKAANLILYSPSPEDKGTYTAHVVSPIGTTTSHGALLSILDLPKPVIVEEPSAHTVAIGDPVMLSVRVRGWSDESRATESSLYTCQWFKDGQPLPGETAAALEFIATSSSGGQYFARISSTGGTTDSAVAGVSLVPTPPLLAIHPPSRFYGLGDDEELRLGGVAFEIWFRRNVGRRGYTGTYVWKKDGQIVSSPFFNGLQPGTYTIAVEQDGVTETSAAFTLGYQPVAVPFIVQHPVGKIADRGEQIELNVSAEAYAPVTYQWFKDGVAVPGSTDYRHAISSFAAGDAGSYHVVVTSDSGSVPSAQAVLEERSGSTPVIVAHPVSQNVVEGRSISLSVNASGGALRYQWTKDGQPIVDATDDEFRFFSISPSSTGDYAVVVTNGSGSVTSHTARVVVRAEKRSPEIVRQPAAQSAKYGGEAVFAVGASGAPPPDRYQWRKDGVDIPGATDVELRLSNLQPGDAGSYSVVVSNPIGHATSSAARLDVDVGGRLVNISTRAMVGTGENVLIAGFVIAGTRPRSVLIRGIGEQLKDAGISGVLRNPILKVFDAKGAMVTSNDEWAWGSNGSQKKDLEEAARKAGAPSLRADTRDAALITTLAPGVYTAILSGVVDTSGIAIVEIYELDRPESTRLINLSSRAFVATDAGIAISGFVLNGRTSRRLLVRALGPALVDGGVTGAIDDPIITLFRGSDPVAQNDNWSVQPTAAEIVQAAARIGAGPLRTNSRDAALLVDLSPGVYTVHAAGVQGSTGVALIEVYEVEP
jgi:hypothetical protein